MEITKGIWHKINKMLIRIPIIPTSGQVHSSFIEVERILLWVSVFILMQVQIPQTEEHDSQYGIPTWRVSSSARFIVKEKMDVLNINCTDKTTRRDQEINFCFLRSMILSQKLLSMRDVVSGQFWRNWFHVKTFQLFFIPIKIFLVTYNFFRCAYLIDIDIYDQQL